MALVEKTLWEMWTNICKVSHSQKFYGVAAETNFAAVQVP